MNELWEKFQANLPSSIGHLVSVLLILLVGWLFYRYLVQSVQRLFVRFGVSTGALSFLFNTIRAVLVCAVVLSVLGQFGVETTSMLALLGASGAALLISLQGFMGNFAAGLVLLSERLVRLGDVIEVGDVRGQVVEMMTLHLVVETAERVRITIPNSSLISGPMRNLSALPTRRVQWLLPVPGGIDLGPIKDALRAVLSKDQRVLQTPEPALFLRDWAMDKQTLAVQVWTASPDAQAVLDQLLEPLGKAIEAHLKETAGKG